ncbi:flagellar basal-body MS-ring/collar protein FliF [Alteriqipengyuania lutimaris]|uniref:Flagellar M-ring protein n=1 Tax=Alteriqipengyuania lutimaris TaxID=1538146 RepID=A0A395LKZ0_9SPHN|nr:flagellar basal-body MS-ring/collar protein FliF [Alteriqipengyuania lutimaris]MBB3033992.1 flagellar M-ring protein FliF [Alteriqipengyuania lutimaris]RDS77057.1 flagellar M-ring protein FliF [Alteriqipengyuania lutimaris]
MAGLVPANNAPQGAPPPPGRGSILEPLTSGSGGMGDRARAFVGQPLVRKVLPWFVGMAGLGVAALLWATLAPGPQRVLYSSLDDASRAAVVASLDQAGIGYQIDNNTGTLTVSEGDLYRARMLVASDGAVAAPETGSDMLENLPLGASRTLEGDRLRAAQERELMLTIQEIEGVESVRVHVAKAERSVFVREDVAPSASIMVRMARGRQLADSQVAAIVNLVAGSVPGLSIDAVRVVDQHGKLLTDRGSSGANSERLDLQSQMEAKLTAQVDQLLAPMIGAQAFSSQVQVELDMNEVTSARESYDKDGAVRRETTQETQMPQTQAGGIPGATANQPPADPQLRDGAPEDTPPAEAQQGPADVSASRTYELGREVSVSNLTPGALKHVSVAVAIDQNALENTSAADIQKIEDLVSAAVGAREERGDIVTVVMRPFTEVVAEEPPFYETGWFAMMVRNGVALIAVLLVLIFVVRPLMKMARGKAGKAEADALPGADGESAVRIMPPESGYDREDLDAQIELAQRFAREQPQDAVLALRRMLAEPVPGQMAEGAAR